MTAGGIFISYRRDDARHAAGRLFDRLSAKHDKIFIDVDNIAPGLDFRKVLAEKVGACDTLLAVIGPGWINARDDDGRRRLDDAADFVRIEIEAALVRDVPVVPVLVDGARMPKVSELPEGLQPLAFRNAVRITHERFAADADGLARALLNMKAAAASQPVATPIASPPPLAPAPKVDRDTPRAERETIPAKKDMTLTYAFAVGGVLFVVMLLYLTGRM